MSNTTIIKGVTIAGWLVLERYITPYLFALTTCDITGNFHSYPNQITTPKTKYHTFPSSFQYDPVKNNTIWDTMECKPIPYPTNEISLISKFENKNIAREYIRRHWISFVRKEDILDLKDSGISHVRVPLGHWILNGILQEERDMYIDGEWQYFLEFCRWCREIGMKVWPFIGTIPGSVDDSIEGWYRDEKNIGRSIHAVRRLVDAIKRDGLEDVITAIGPLIVKKNAVGDHDNHIIIRKFYNDALEIIRRAFPKDSMGIFIDDLNNVGLFDGYWMEEKYSNTYLESHYSHVGRFDLRSLSPRQHIAYVCRNTTRDLSCCNQGSSGIQRIVGDWSVAFDILPSKKIDKVMEYIAIHGAAPDFDRAIPQERERFLQKYAQAQILTFENNTKGWFYSNFKMEGGVFAEMDYLRGVREGWLSDADEKTCSDIIFETKDDMSIVHPFPPVEDDELNIDLDDDVVVSHGKSLISNDDKEEMGRVTSSPTIKSILKVEPKESIQENNPSTEAPSESPKEEKKEDHKSYMGNHSTFKMFIGIIVIGLAWVRLKRFVGFSSNYENIPAMELHV